MEIGNKNTRPRSENTSRTHRYRAHRSREHRSRSKSKSRIDIEELKRRYNDLYNHRKKNTHEIDKIKEEIYNYEPNLKDESFVFTLNTHGSYDDMDSYKKEKPMFNRISSNTHDMYRIIEQYKQRKLPELPVPVYIISGAPIGMTYNEMFEETVKGKKVYNHTAQINIVDELMFNSFLTPMNREKQFIDVSNKLRQLYLHGTKLKMAAYEKYIRDIKPKLQELELELESELYENEELNEKIAQLSKYVSDSYKKIEHCKEIIRHIDGAFNIHRFKKGDVTGKFFSEDVNRHEDLGIFTVRSEKDWLNQYEYYKRKDQQKWFYEKIVNGKLVEKFYFSLDDFLDWHYSTSTKKPEYYVIVDFSCSIIRNQGFHVNATAIKQYVKSYRKRHLNVAKRSFNKTSRLSSRRSL